MRNVEISLCYHPTTIVFVDDNEDYLLQMQTIFKNVLPTKTFTDQNAAIKFLNKALIQENFVQRCTIIPEDDTFNKFEPNIHINNLIQELYRPNRYDDVAIIVIDYAMPQMNGLEFAKKIKTPNSRILMLTGEADKETVISAFNDGLIDKYLPKSSDIESNLTEAIMALNQQYFIDLSNRLINLADPKRLQCLENTKVVEHFVNFYQEHDIVEYYLLTDRGDFLMLDRNGTPFWFTVFDEDEFIANYEYARDCKANALTLEALKKKEKIPLFYSATITAPDPDYWHFYLNPAHKIEDTPYYYAFKSTIAVKEDSLKPFVCLNKFLKNSNF